MDDPPKPWDELLHILQLSSCPIPTSLHWLNERKHSSLYPNPPDFNEFMIFLCNAVPSVDGSDSKLILKPRLSQFSSNLQSLLLEFLQLNICYFSSKVIVKLWNHIERYYSECDATAALLRVLQSVKAGTSELDAAMSHNLMAKKRPINKEDSNSPPPLKKMKVAPNTTEISNQTHNFKDLQFAVETKNTHKFIFFLETLEATSLSLVKVCDKFSFDETWLVSVGEELIAKEDEKVVMLFLNPFCAAFIKQSPEGPSRQFVQMLVQFSKQFCLFDCLVSYVSQAISMSREQSTCVASLSKQTLNKEQQFDLFCKILENTNLAIASLDAVVVLYLGFLRLQLPMRADSCYALCNFFTSHAKSAANHFAFAKLLLTFLKQQISIMSLENIENMKEVVNCNSTSLASACKALLAKRSKEFDK